MNFDIVSVGSAVVDAFVDTGLPEMHGEMCYRLGMKIAVRGLELHTGGGGTNTAVAFAKLGLKTGYIGSVGNDGNADIILKELNSFHIPFLGGKSEAATGYSVVLDSKDHERTVLTFKGASDTLRFEDIPLERIDTKWFYFSSMAGEGFTAQEKLVSWAQRKGTKIAFNPSSYLAAKGARYLRHILKKTEIIVLNDEEAKMLVPKGDLFEGLHSLGPKIVCITYGPKGNAVSDGKRRYVSLPHHIKIRERTGAGDAFAAGFVAGYIKSDGDIEFAIQTGSLDAESVVLFAGAKPGQLTWKQVSIAMKRNPVKIIEKG